MQLFSTHDEPSVRSRGWLMEILVVLGILGFGYFAVMLETTPRAGINTELATH